MKFIFRPLSVIVFAVGVLQLTIAFNSQIAHADSIPDNCELEIDGQSASGSLDEVNPGKELNIVCRQVRVLGSNREVGTELAHVSPSQNTNGIEDDVWRIWVRPEDTASAPDIYDESSVTLDLGVYDIQVIGMVPPSLRGDGDVPRDLDILSLEGSDLQFTTVIVSDEYQRARSELAEAQSRLLGATPDTRAAVQLFVDNSRDKLDIGSPVDAYRLAQAAIRAIDAMDGFVGVTGAEIEDLEDEVKGLKQRQIQLLIAVGIELLIIIGLLVAVGGNLLRWIRGGSG